MKELDTFAFGVIVGVVFLATILMLTKRSPVDMEKKMQQEAISHGAAHYKVDTNGVVTFEWNK
jgi:hypothetical protein